MRRTRGFKALASLAVMMMIVTLTQAQQPGGAIATHKKNSERVTRQSNPSRAKSGDSTYAPQINGRSSSFVVEGRITGLGNNVITIKTARGARHDFGLDGQTSVFDSGELVSVATMADIALSAYDLHVSDSVEIVTERIGRREVARIITRIASSDAQVAKR